LIDEDHPDRSAILMAPGGPGEDGLLQIREIVSLDLRDRIVCLSACRSAGGAIVDGEGPLGLARAFFQAGARVVVGSLWPLRDDEARSLVGAFYRRLAEGRSVAESLALARRDRLLAGAPAAEWAALVVLGDGDAVPFPAGGRVATGEPSGAWRVVPIAALAVVVLLLRRRRRRV
jgi:MYXO-CTERM domain-containing protein